MKNLPLILALASLTGCVTPAATVTKEEAAPAVAPPAVEEDVPPEEPARAGRIVERDVRIGELVGTLTAPEGEGRRPAMLITHDFGPTHRDGHVRAELGVDAGVEVATYRDLARALARRGVVTLRWDKRTCVTGAAPRCAYPRERLEEASGMIASALVEDAAAARAWLSARPEVDPTRIGAIGHGEGAWVALALDARAPLSGLALIAPSSHGLAEQIDHQLALSERYAREALAASTPGADADAWRVHVDALVEARDEARDGFERLRRGEEPERVAGVARATWEDREALRERAMKRLADTPTRLLLIHLPDDEGAPADTAARLTGVRADAPAIALPGVTRGLIALEGERAQIPEALVLALESFARAGSSR